MTSNAQEKAEQLLKDKGVAQLTDTDKFEYFICQGRSKPRSIYEIIFNKIDEEYSCTCKNLRDLDCSHIIAVKLFKETRVTPEIDDI